MPLSQRRVELKRGGLHDGFGGLDGLGGSGEHLALLLPVLPNTKYSTKRQLCDCFGGFGGCSGTKVRTEKNSLKTKFRGRIFLGHQRPTRRAIPDVGPGMSRTITLCEAPLSVVLDREWPDVPRFGSGRPRI